MLPVESAQTVAGAMSVVTGNGLTVSTTSSVAVHAGVELLLTVKRNVTVPVPVMLTPVVAVFGLTIVAAAVPVEVTTVHAGVAGEPLENVPVTVKAVGPLAA